MEPLHFYLEEIEDPAQLADFNDDQTCFFMRDVINILRQYLSTQTLNLQQAMDNIISLLPKKGVRQDGAAYKLHSIWDVIIKVAEWIPYYHPGQVMLIQLVERLGNDWRVIAFLECHKKPNDVTPHPLYLFGSETRELGQGSPYYDAEISEMNRHQVNIASFLAKGTALGVSDLDQYGLWALRDAFQSHPFDLSNKEGPVIRWGSEGVEVRTAAQWMIYAGHSMSMKIFLPPATHPYDSYEKTTFHTWQTWKAGFYKAHRTEGAHQDARDLAGRAERLMVLYEETWKELGTMPLKPQLLLTRGEAPAQAISGWEIIDKKLKDEGSGAQEGI